MNIRPFVFSIVLTVLGTGYLQNTQAQVFIPDTTMRSWLNGYIPDVVDAFGIMDTLHPSIADLDQAFVQILPFGLESLDLTGLQYLDSLSSFNIDLVGMEPGFEFTLTGVPQSLRSLNVVMMCASIVLPRLPEKMDYISFSNIGACDSGLPVLSIAGMPDSLQSMQVQGVANLEWPETGYIGYLSVDAIDNVSTTVIPAIQIGTLSLEIGAFPLDASAVNCTDVGYMGGYGLAEIIWPQNMLALTVNGVAGGLGTMPSTLETLYIWGATITCLPFLPNGLTYLYVDYGIDCIPNWPSALTEANFDGEIVTQEIATYCSVLNSDCIGGYPGIAGRVIMDTNSNGQYDDGESGLPQGMVVIQPGGNSVGCNDIGIWETSVLPGSYTMTPSSSYPYIASIAPLQHTANVPNMGDHDMDNDFGATLIPNMQDLRVMLSANPARPGFENRLYLSCQNYGTMPMDADITLTYDGGQSWVGSSIAPDIQNATTATWNLSDIAVGETRHIAVDLYTAASVALGTGIIHSLVADPMVTDETPSNNSYTLTDTVVGSCDPNDKLLAPKVLPPAVVAQGETPLEYTIRFQNTGTYLAERVVILDTLSEDLQWESMQFIASSHPNHWYITDGVLHVFHDGIMLPDSTSDEPNSHGFFSFSMLPATDLQDGATVTNIAHIVFDFNEPIITPPAVFSVDVLAGITSIAIPQTFQLVPNPAHDRIQIRLESAAMVQYRVNDALGRVVLNGTVTPNGWLDLQALSPGPYFLDVLHNDSWTSQRFMKQ